MSSLGSYKAREFNLSGLNGISDETLEMHFKLYKGYVKETNKLTEAITKFIQDGNVAGFDPVLVMDVWEHAYLLDYKPAERPKYIEAFFSNIDWSIVEKRLKKDVARTAGA